MKLKVELEIDKHRLIHLLIGALEGGSNYWIRSYKKVLGDKAAIDKDLGKEFHDFPQYYCASSFSDENYLLIKDDEDMGEYRINLKTMQEGLQVFSSEFPEHFSYWLQEQDDAESADIFLQCCCFKKLVFG